MKKIFYIIALFFITIFSFLNVNALGSADEKIYICSGNECGLEQGVDMVKTGVKDIDTTGTATDKIQEVVKYLLGFITLIAVIYIIYAGFRILTSSGEDETIKNSKKTIIYVIIGILVIWFAWTIANFAVDIGASANK